MGLMPVGRYYDQDAIYGAAAAFERACDWTMC